MAKPEERRSTPSQNPREKAPTGATDIHPPEAVTRVTARPDRVVCVSSIAWT